MRKARAMRHMKTHRDRERGANKSEPHFQVKNCGEKKGFVKGEQNRRQSK